MASSTQRVLLLHLAILIGLLSISANARPCKTLFISSYSITFNPRFDGNPDQENPSLNFIRRRSAGGSLTLFTEIRDFNPRQLEVFFDEPSRLSNPLDFRSVELEPRVAELESRPTASRLFSSPVFDSLRNRTKDLLSVVVALLFGVGCGMLTAATMYFVWSLFSSRYEFNSSYDEFDVEDDASPKKMGYVKIPADGTPAPAKEVV